MKSKIVLLWEKILAIIGTFTVVFGIFAFVYNAVPHPKLEFEELFVTNVFPYEIECFHSSPNNAITSESQDKLVSYHIIRVRNTGRTIIEENDYVETIKLHLQNGEFIYTPLILHYSSPGNITRNINPNDFTYLNDTTLKIPLLQFKSGDFFDFVIAVKCINQENIHYFNPEGKIRNQRCIDIKEYEYKGHRRDEIAHVADLFLLTIFISFIGLLLRSKYKDHARMNK